MDEDTIKEVLNLKVPDEVKGSPVDVFELYEELITSTDIDEDLDRAHVIYAFCVLMADEFNIKAIEIESHIEKEEANLKAWQGRKWAKLKGSARRCTDNDAIRQIDSHRKTVKFKHKIADMRLEAAKYKKLYRQLAFGGGKGLELKAKSLQQRVYREYKALGGDFNVRDNDIKDNIKNRIKRISRKVKSRLKRSPQTR